MSLTFAVELGLIVLVVLMMAGCTSSGDMLKALAADPASACATVATPYGTVAVVRANRPGVRASASGGQCTVETPVER